MIEALERPFYKGTPQAQRGTIAEHLLSLAKLAQRLADHYPMVDRDLLVTGALLHDIAKVRDKRDTDSLDEARLVGHAVMAAQAIHDKAAQIPNFPRALEHHVVHLVLSHLGSPERGAPRPPMTLEALLLASAIQIDAEVSSWLELMGRDPQPHHRKPRRPNGADRRKSSAPTPAPESEREVARQEESQDKSLPKELVFKPLSEIATEPAAAEPDEPPPPSPSAETP